MHLVIMWLGGITAGLGVFFWLMAGVTSAAGTLSAPILYPIAVGFGLLLVGAIVYSLGRMIDFR